MFALPLRLAALVEAKRHLWRTNTNPSTISEADKLLSNVVKEYERHLTPEQRSMVVRAL